MRSLIIVCIFASCAFAATSCATSKTITVPSSVTSGKIARVSVHADARLTVNTVAGSAWGFVVHGDDSAFIDAVGIDFGGLNPDGSFDVLVKNDGGSISGSSFSSPSPLSVVAAVVIALAASASASFVFGHRAAFLVAAPVLAIAAPVLFCSRGTLLITYPPGAQIFVRGLNTPTCSALTSTPAAVATPTQAYGLKYLNSSEMFFSPSRSDNLFFPFSFLGGVAVGR